MLAVATQLVRRHFTIRWTPGCIATRLHGELDLGAKLDIHHWAQTLAEVLTQVPGEFVTLLDTSQLGDIPRGLWFDLAKLAHEMSRKPLRRALIVADGGVGDNQAQAAQLVTAGSVRAFTPDEIDAAIDWLAEANTISAERLSDFILG
jgi:hypothetical protein